MSGGAWTVSYVVDVAEHAHEVVLGQTPPTDCAADTACAAEFACERIDLSGVPPRCKHVKQDLSCSAS